MAAAADDLPEPPEFERQRSRSVTPPLADSGFEDYYLDEGPKDKVRVVCRFRPLLRDELTVGPQVCAEFPAERNGVIVEGGDGVRHAFAFRRVYDMSTTQELLFREVGEPAVRSVLEGYNAAVICYGQTGSGKTYTMMGPPNAHVRGGVDMSGLDRGLMPRMMDQLFAAIGYAEELTEYSIICSFVEIYQEEIYDLLSNDREPVKVQTAGDMLELKVVEVPCANIEDVFLVLRQGARGRSTAGTAVNERSSRSHAIFRVEVICHDLRRDLRTSSLLQLVDLAGSERAEQTGGDDDRRKEARAINQSLLALGNVCVALTRRRPDFIPYRSSKLTRLLQSSFGGDSRTSLIVNCSPHLSAFRETLSSLRFGDRAANIRNKPSLQSTIDFSRMRRHLEELRAVVRRQDMRLVRYRLILNRFKKLASDTLAQRGIPSGVMPELTQRYPVLQLLDQGAEMIRYMPKYVIMNIMQFAGGIAAARMMCTNRRMERCLRDERLWQWYGVLELGYRGTPEGCFTAFENRDGPQPNPPTIAPGSVAARMKPTRRVKTYYEYYANVKKQWLDEQRAEEASPLLSLMARMGEGGLHLVRTRAKPQRGRRERKGRESEGEEEEEEEEGGEEGEGAAEEDE